MLFSDITDCEMLAFRIIMQSPEPVSLSEVMSRLEELYGRGWKQTTVCTFLSHLVDKGYIKAERRGRSYYYSSAINNASFIKEQARQFVSFWFDGSAPDAVHEIAVASGMSAGQADSLEKMTRQCLEKSGK
ncbi:MAG: BlaI/MecI/CopY family transcriptional regulator [Lachnospiraceae bacterium]|jgi:predicted transcriptional regulator